MARSVSAVPPLAAGYLYVRPRMRRRNAVLETQPLLDRFSLGCAHQSGALNSSLAPFARAARSLAVGEPVHTVKNIGNARVGCPSFGGQLTTELSWKSRERCVSRHRVFGETQLQCNNQTAEVRSLMQPVLSSKALRSTAAPGRWFGAGTGFARAGHVGALGHQGTQTPVSPPRRARLDTNANSHPLAESALSNPRPNPSIEGTSTSKLRLLAAAPHVKR